MLLVTCLAVSCIVLDTLETSSAASSCLRYFTLKIDSFQPIKASSGWFGKQDPLILLFSFDKGEFLGARQTLNCSFAFEGLGAIGYGFLIDKLDRGLVPGVKTAISGIVLFETTRDICGNTGVERFIAALDYVEEPGHEMGRVVKKACFLLLARLRSHSAAIFCRQGKKLRWFFDTVRTIFV